MKSFISLSLLVSIALASVSTARAASIEPRNRDAAIAQWKTAFAALASAQESIIGRRHAEAEACREIGIAQAMYEAHGTRAVPIGDGKKSAQVTAYVNGNLNRMTLCDPESIFERANTIVAVHVEMVRLYEAKIAEAEPVSSSSAEAISPEF